MQQAVEDRGRDDRVAEDRAPFAVALVGRQDDAAPFVTRADQLKEDRRAEIIQWQISHLVDDEHLRCEIDSKPSVEASFTIGPAQVGHQGGVSNRRTAITRAALRGGRSQSVMSLEP